MANDFTGELWRSLKSWAIVTAVLVLAALFIAIPLKDVITKQVAADLNIIHEQNKRSIEDRAYMREELGNTREALKRLEQAVKSGEKP